MDENEQVLRENEAARRAAATEPPPANQKLTENELLRYDNYSLRVHNAQLRMNEAKESLVKATRDWVAHCQQLTMKYGVLVDHTTLQEDGTISATAPALPPPAVTTG